jgi:formate hydrogenlyase subunit 6/NADH:ubiquinone oxidoreductase subunit I
MSAADKLRPQPFAWKWLALPVLDETLCTGCGWCPEVCPTACLAMGTHMPWLPRPWDCVSCGLCVDVCPTGALSLRVEE